MADVEIFTRPGCGYCARAKALLESKGVAFREYDAYEDPSARDRMIERSNRQTFPQIFIDGKHIGGCDDLQALNSRGGLDPLLAS